MSRTRLPAVPSHSTSTLYSRSSLPPPRPWHQCSHVAIVSLLVALVLPLLLLDQAHAVQMSVKDDDANAQKQSNDRNDQQDVRVNHLDRQPVVKNPKGLDNPHPQPGGEDSLAQNINTNPDKQQAVLQKEAAVNLDKSRDVPLAQPLQKEAGRNEQNEEMEKKRNLKQQRIEERERFVNEQLRQQELKKQQYKIQQQSHLEAQKEQQQQWLKEVHRKSQEALTERHNQQQQQDVQAANKAPEVLDSPQHVTHVDTNQEQPNLQKTIFLRNKIYINNSSRVSHLNSTTNTSLLGGNSNKTKASTNYEGRHLNNSYQRKRQQPDTFVLAGESRSVQGQLDQNQEAKPGPVRDQHHESSNKSSNSESVKKMEPSALVVNAQVLGKEGNGSRLSSDDTDSHGNSNLNPGNQNDKPAEVVNNNNQWTKYELNNGQQQQTQQEQQQQQQEQQQPQQQQEQQQPQQQQQEQQQPQQEQQQPQQQYQQEQHQPQQEQHQPQQEQHQPQQEQQQQPQIGGINLSWDWEDFSVMFNSYGAAEMKVRRSPHPTTGEPWPLPQYYSKKDEKVYKLSKDLHFIPTGVKCDILEEALTRHLQRTLRGCVEDMYDNLQNAEGSPIEDPTLRYERDEFLKAPVITRVEVKVRKPCEKYPSLESDESYDLVVKKRKTYIWANEVWGALRGLETFGHLVWRGIDGFLYMKETVISDYPRFPHRGLHIDTSRHFLFKEIILDILDSMEMNKLNVFHWHIVDDQSFPYESKVYPELSRKGAFHPSYVYTLEDIAEIIEYARLRGIRVMPEFDTPGHTFAWGLSRPELLTQCYSGSVPVKGYLGPIDPSKNSTYRFLQTLFKEIAEVFKDQYLHLGGDEVPLGCWQSNPEVAAFAQELSKKPQDTQQNQAHYAQNANFGGGWSMWSDDIRRVYEYYENRLINIVNEIGQKRKKGIKYVMWQEVMNNNLQLPNDTIIQVWMGDMADVMRATSMGYQVIYSTCWYMDHIEYGTKWPKYYNCDPVDQSFGFHIDEKKVLGGEAAFWAEYFSNENLIPLMWPRASAAAERLWSNKEVKSLDKAAERLAEHRCRMIKRGINAGEINGPGYCLHSPPKRRLFNDTAGCKGGNCSRTYNFVQIEDFEVHVSHRGGSLADCGNVFTQGNSNVFILLTLALIVVVALYALSKSSSQFHRMRICKNRSILIVFVGVLLVYLLCYTTIWMRAFEFSGSFHKTLQEDNRSGNDGGTDDDGNHFRPISS